MYLKFYIENLVDYKFKEEIIMDKNNSKINELRERLKLYRIYYPMSQKELSEKSGVSERSISRFENGEDINLSNFIKLLTALDLDKNLSVLIPDQRDRPSYYLEKPHERARVGKKKTPSATFKWGDEE